MGIEHLVLGIQRDEFGLALTADNQPDLKDVAGFFAHAKSGFWVAQAMDDGALIGCIGLEALSDDVAVMRKFMVHRDWRGAGFGVATALHERFVAHAQAKGFSQIALSTVASTAAAQRFYARNGYRSIALTDMPDGFVPGVLDVVFMLAQVSYISG
jgi:GNAT superfamily N-acetyltransferase